ncbi:3-phosphoshikimate 1-carboxyvinyltransferase [Nocardioides sp. CF8]|nr:3-phosphoshikimate 1-carboxyvinyltransferase [Nocardioides sp. CF8]
MRRPLISEDTLAFAEALRTMGTRVDRAEDSWTVEGTSGDFASLGTVWCADAGTAARFLPPVAGLVPRGFSFDGSDQLRRRPLGPLLGALRSLGAEVWPTDGHGLPISVKGAPQQLSGPREIELPSGLSSQFVSGLLMAAPLARGLTLRTSDLVSRPYVDMSITLMADFGVLVDEPEPGVFVVPDQPLRSPGVFAVEPDASTASYVFAGAALTRRAIRVDGLGRNSLQGDLAFVDVLAQMGCSVAIGDHTTSVTGAQLPLRGGFTVDMGEISDTFMTAACLAPFADAPIRITGVAHARLKESDRIAAVATNLRAAGVRVDEGDSWLEIHPGRPQPARIDCHRDHRIAMSFSVLGLRADGIMLDDPACVGKTFPGFFEEFDRLFRDPS